MKKESDESFRVVDRRRFTESGVSRPEGEQSASASQAAEPSPIFSSPPEVSGGTMQRESAGESAQAGVHDMPPIDFSQFVLSLATSAQMAMGLVQHPASEATTQDLPAARQTIEILAMLHEKTRGNLQPEERKLFEEILYLLRMQYVEITKKP